MDEEKFILEVKNRPWLYNIVSVEYKDQQKKKNSWKELACIFGVTEKEAMTKWKCLRTCYNREMRQHSKSGGLKRKKWPLTDVMSFLEPYRKERRTVSNMLHKESILTDFLEFDSQEVEIRNNPIENDYVYVLASSSQTDRNVMETEKQAKIAPTPTKKRKPEVMCAIKAIDMAVTKYLAEKRPQDPNSQFLQGLAVHFKDLTSDKQAELRRRIYKTIIEYEEENL